MIGIWNPKRGLYLNLTAILLGVASFGAVAWNISYSKNLKLASKVNGASALEIEKGEFLRSASIIFAYIGCLVIIALYSRAVKAGIRDHSDKSRQETHADLIGSPPSS